MCFKREYRHILFNRQFSGALLSLDFDLPTFDNIASDPDSPIMDIVWVRFTSGLTESHVSLDLPYVEDCFSDPILRVIVHYRL